MNKQETRIKEIIKTVKEQRRVSINYLAEKFNVSVMTIRRDIGKIDNSEIDYYHGILLYLPPVFSNQQDDSPYSIITALTKKKEEKQRIARKALSLIKPNESILLSSGSTTEYLAKIIPSEWKMEIICSSLNNVNILLNNPNCRLTIPGGEFHASSMVFQSAEGLEMLKKMRVKTTFISAYGVDINLGATCSASFERDLRQTEIQIAETRVLLADSSKFGRIDHIHFAEITDFDIIITDTALPAETADKIRDLGLTLYTV